MAAVLEDAAKGQRTDERLWRSLVRSMYTVRQKPIWADLREAWQQCRFDPSTLNSLETQIRNARNAYKVASWNAIKVKLEPLSSLDVLPKGVEISGKAVVQTVGDVKRVFHKYGRLALRVAHGHSRGSRSRMRALLEACFPVTFRNQPEDVFKQMFPDLMPEEKNP